jgi:hypothetical protein
VLADAAKLQGYDPRFAPMYAQMLVGMVALVGQWWLDVRRPGREEVAAHLVNLAWNGLAGLDPTPSISAESRDLVIPPTSTVPAVPAPPAPSRLSDKEWREQEKARERQLKEMQKARAKELREQEKQLKEQEKARARELRDQAR